MMKFLVYLENEFNIKNKSTWRFITATSKKEAIMKFINHTSINDKYFLKQIYVFFFYNSIGIKKRAASRKETTLFFYPGFQPQRPPIILYPGFAPPSRIK